MMEEENDHKGQKSNDAADRIGSEGFDHTEHSLGYDCDGNQLEAVQDAGGATSGEEGVAFGESEHQDCGRECEAEPRSAGSGQAGFEQTDGEADLAA
jgi:hypothetical protein